MRKIQIVGGSFLEHSKSASLREDNADVHPTHFQWDDAPYQGFETKNGFGNGVSTSPVFYCDGGLRKCSGITEQKKVGWLVEPRHLHPENYEYAEANQDKFDVILTYDRRLLDACKNARFYPLGGSSIRFDRWGVYPKSRGVCMFVSDKRSTEGHKLRHKIAKQFGDKIDCYGKGVNKPFKSKYNILKDYRYCVVVESGRTRNYFSEKLIDALSVGCMLLYWGNEKSDRITDRGIVVFESIEDLEVALDYHLSQIHKGIYEYHLASGAAEMGIKAMRQYRICENWIYENYPEIFNG